MPDADLEAIACPVCSSERRTTLQIIKPFRIVHCGECGLSYLNPRLKESVIKRIYSDHDYFSGGEGTGYGDYTVQEQSLRVTFRRFLLEMKRLGLASGRLLEIGCGYGYFLDEARAFFPSLSGTDLSPEAAMHANKIPDVTVWPGDIYSLPEDWRDFDVIVAINVIEHIYSPLDFVVALKQRLKTGGRIVLATPDFGSPWAKMLGKKWPSLKIPEHVVFYNSTTLNLLLERAGFRDVQEIHFWHAFPLGLICSKLGVTVGRRFGNISIGIPRTMIALSAEQ